MDIQQEKQAFKDRKREEKEEKKHKKEEKQADKTPKKSPPVEATVHLPYCTGKITTRCIDKGPQPVPEKKPCPTYNNGPVARRHLQRE